MTRKLRELNDYDVHVLDVRDDADDDADDFNHAAEFNHDDDADDFNHTDDADDFNHAADDVSK